eukprot:Clim_evm27s238 gene=Clim_evmTU27s238
MPGEAPWTNDGFGFEGQRHLSLNEALGFGTDSPQQNENTVTPPNPRSGQVAPNSDERMQQHARINYALSCLGLPGVTPGDLRSSSDSLVQAFCDVLRVQSSALSEMKSGREQAEDDVRRLRSDAERLRKIKDRMEAQMEKKEREMAESNFHMQKLTAEVKSLTVQLGKEKEKFIAMRGEAEHVKRQYDRKVARLERESERIKKKMATVLTREARQRSGGLEMVETLQKVVAGAKGKRATWQDASVHDREMIDHLAQTNARREAEFINENEDLRNALRSVEEVLVSVIQEQQQQYLEMRRHLETQEEEEQEQDANEEDDESAEAEEPTGVNDTEAAGATAANTSELFEVCAAEPQQIGECGFNLPIAYIRENVTDSMNANLEALKSMLNMQNEQQREIIEQHVLMPKEDEDDSEELHERAEEAATIIDSLKHEVRHYRELAGEQERLLQRILTNPTASAGATSSGGRSTGGSLSSVMSSGGSRRQMTPVQARRLNMSPIMANLRQVEMERDSLQRELASMRVQANQVSAAVRASPLRSMQPLGQSTRANTVAPAPGSVDKYATNAVTEVDEEDKENLGSPVRASRMMASSRMTSTPQQPEFY